MSYSTKAAAQNVIMAGVTPATRRVKSPRTLSLNDEFFRQLQEHCHQVHCSASQIIDELIRSYLDGLKNNK